MRFTDDFIEEVRAKNNIVDVISGYVRLTRKGSSYMGLCPFHGEKTPSFSVHPGRQMYHCFGCGASGDVFSFLMEYDRNTFQEAVANLAQRAGMELPEDTGDEDKKREDSKRARLLEINKEAAKFYYIALQKKGGAAALSYLRNRGLTDETIKSFGLGYSEKTGTALYRYLKGKGYDDALLKESGLFSVDKKGEFRDKFWNRVMFPIMDINRRVIGFGGRVMGDSKPKYLNSPETVVFNKSRNLYGLYEAKTAGRRRIILCEGYMDVIAMHQAGFKNAAASLGTAFTSQMANMIRRYTSEAVLMYDSDEAGITAALRAIPILREAGVGQKVVDLSPYKDPDEFIKGLGAEELDKRINNAENGFLFEVRQLQKNYDMNDPQGVADFRNEVTKRLLNFPDEIERSAYMESLSRIYNIDIKLMQRQLGNLAMRGITAQKESPPSEADTEKKRAKDTRAVRTEKLLVCWISRSPALLKKIKEYITPDDFTDPVARKIVEKLLASGPEYTPASVLNIFEDEDEKQAAARILEMKDPPDVSAEMDSAVREVLTTIKNNSYDRELENMNRGDMQAMQRMLDQKKALEDLKKRNF